MIDLALFRTMHAAAGSNQSQLPAPHWLPHQYTAQGGPEIDTSDISCFTDMRRCLGETGVATLPLQPALAVQASRQSGAISAVVHLRADGAGATIVFVRPTMERPCAR